MSHEAEKKNLFFRLILPLILVAGVVGLIWGVGAYQRAKSTERKIKWIEHFEKLEAAVDDEAHGNLDRLRKLPLAYKERVQPLDSVARRTIRSLTGDRTVYGADPVLVFLSMAFDGISDGWNEIPIFMISYGVNRPRVGIDNVDKLATYDQIKNSELTSYVAEVRKEFANKASQMSMPDQELVRAHATYARELELGFQHLFFIAPPNEAQRIADDARQADWHLPIAEDLEGHDPKIAREVQTAYADLRTAWRARDKGGIKSATERLLAATTALDPAAMPDEKRISDEISLNLVNPFTRASWLYLFASIFALFSWAFRLNSLRWIAILAGVIGMALTAFGFYMRVQLGFGVTVTNLYESMVAISFTTMLICIVLDLLRGSSFGILVGGIGAFVLLAILDRYSDKFDSAIGGTIAVLANNIWVHIHVPIVMASYAAYLIAFMLAVIAIPWCFRDPKASDPDLKGILKTAEIATNVGTLLIFIGMVLGGVWAADSWGRFWGWDPKETWSAILFLFYIIVIHLRLVGFKRTIGGVTKSMKMSPFWYSMCLFTGGNILLWTYYGTNELLSGLHSYANSSGGAGFWDNLIHDRNRWFVWTSGSMLVLTILASVAYLMLAPKAAPTISKANAAA